nr:uncharacterized protein LOC119179483 [Rhipicephalus microplus]
MDVKRCPRCPFSSPQFTKIVSHIGLAHSAEPGFRIFCGIGGCANTYKIFSSYRSHLYRQHKDVLEESGSNFSGSHSAATDNVSCSLFDQFCPEYPSDVNCAEGINGGDQAKQPPQKSSATQSNGQRTFVEQAKSTLWNFFFSVIDQHSLPHTAVEKLFSELRFVFEQLFVAYANEISNAMSTSQPTSILNDLLKCNFVEQIFSGLQSRRKRDKYAEMNFPLVAPKQQIIGQNSKYHYVPLPKLLSVLCNVPDIAAHLTTPEAENHTPTVYRDFTDGQLYRQHLRSLVSSTTTHTIVLLFYSDEIEIVNPLGAKRGKHKLLAVYCTLLNLHVKYRSQLRNIYLVMIVRYIDVNQYGLKAILQPLVDDLKHLYEHGMSFNLDGMEQRAEVLVFGFCGDNLSLNHLGGFSCCFSSGRVCRFCMVSSKQLADKTSDDVCQARTANRHQLHLQALAVSSLYNKRLYGVNEESPLLELPYFDVTRQLPLFDCEKIFQVCQSLGRTLVA